MGHNLTETATYTATIAVPDDLDDAVATTGGADVPLEDPLQILANRTKFLHDARQDGVLLGGDGLYAPGDGNVYVPAVKSVVIGGVQLAGASGFTIAATGLSAHDDWYYVYLINSSGTLAAAIGRGATWLPAADLVWRNGGVTHRYLGCFRTDGSGNAYPFRKSGRHYEYRWSANVLINGGVLAAASSYVAAPATLLLAPGGAGTPFLPPHARLADLVLSGQPAGGTTTALDFGTNGDGPFTLRVPSAGFVRLTLECDGAQQISYSTAGTDDRVSIAVMGFKE